MWAPCGVGRILAGAPSRGKRRAHVTGLLLVLLVAIGCSPESPESAESNGAPAPPGREVAGPAAEPAPTHAGTASCLECHADVGARWRDSDHDRAMEEASASSVLGDFSARDVLLDGQRWSFAVRDGEYVVSPPPEDGTTAELPIAYTFGVRPLQQYLVRGERGRLQPLPVAWDSRPREAGGQRWVHVYEGEGLRAADPLHWTGRVQTWNHQCAACHSTALERGYDEAADRYDTRWAELDVACEACHGPGSRHVARARGGDAEGARAAILGLRRSPGEWVIEDGTAIARRTLPAEHRDREVDTCAPCHSRRARIDPDAAPGQAFLDGYMPSLIEEGLYFADGRMRDEVYVWGSFAQSRMHAAGVGCSDCHDPHSLEVRGGPDGACASCHAPATFATPEHHFHASDSPGASCVACHMPERTYMQIDGRRDHSLRVPRPDVAAATGSPTVCTPCHAGTDAAWARAELERRGALRTTPHPGLALAAGVASAPDAGEALAALVGDGGQPAMFRASAALLLGRELEREQLPALRAALEDPEPLVRLGAVRALDSLAPSDRLALGRARLLDPLRAVRVEAARTLVEAPPDAWPAGSRTALADALTEYRRAQQLNADRIEGQLNLSALELQVGNPERAALHARAAVSFAPGEPAAHVNLADALRRSGDEAGAEQVLREGLERTPDSAELELALGLSLIRQGRSEEAVEAIGRAYRLAPATARVAYTWALALQSVDRSAESVAVLERAARDHPRNRDILLALVTIERDRGRTAAATRWAEALVELEPDDPRILALRESLQPGSAPSADGPSAPR